MLGPAADPERQTPAEGDLRLLISEMNGRPTAVIYRAVAPGAPRKQDFRSPVQNVSFDEVCMLNGAKAAVKRSDAGYTVEAAVPLADLGIAPAAGQTLRGDLGVLFSDGSGVQCVRRSYWSNRNTGVTADVPTEARLQPAEWGRFDFE